MVLTILGKLVDPTNQYGSEYHRVFSQCLVWVITIVVGNVTTLAFLGQVTVTGAIVLNVIDPGSIFASWIFTFLWIWSLVEVIFYCYCLRLKSKLNIPMTLPTLTREEKEFLLDMVLEECDDPWPSLVGWFHLDPDEDYGLESLASWISWAYFGKLEAVLGTEETQELNGLVNKIVKKCPHLGKATGKTSDNFMKLHLDEVVVQHKPFVAYVVISVMQIVGSLFLRHLDFHHHKLPESRLSYWTYFPIKNKDEDALPPIFIVHGIGIGIAMYFKLVQAVRNKHPDRAIFILELPHISLKILDRIPSIEDTLAAVDTIFNKYSLTGCSFLAHSYGTIVTTWIVKERPEFVHKIVYVDPVCFALWEPDLIFNFLYHIPLSPIHRLCQFFVSQDLVVSSTLFRNFSWLRNILFPDTIPCPTSVFISSHDFIINPQSIHKYLVRHNDRVRVRGQGRAVNVEIMDGLSHGGILSSEANIGKVIDQI